MDLLFNVLTVSGGLSGVAGLIMCWVVYRQFAADRQCRAKEEEQRRQLAHKLEALETEKIASLQKRVDEHIEKDKSQELLTEMRHINGNLEKLSAQVGRALEANARQSSEIENNRQFIENLREDLHQHVSLCHRGG